MGKAFVGFYYPEFSKDRSANGQLASVYTDQVFFSQKLKNNSLTQSCLTFEGAQFQGKAPILEKLSSLPFKQVVHQVTTIDAQPIIGVDDNKVRKQRRNVSQILGCRRDGDWAAEGG